MSWKMIGEPKTRKLTRGLAEEFSGMTPAPHDRPLNPTRCAIIKTAFEKGAFRTCEWASAFCEQTKQKYRINGKHTSTVLASMNGEFPKGLSVIVEEYKCDTLEDVANLYSTFDPRSSARSTGDINQIYAAIIPSLEDVSGRVINAVVSGIAYAIWEDGYTQQPVEDRAKLIVAGADFAVWVNDLVTGVSNDKITPIRRAAVIGAMYKTWQKAKADATEFWRAVRDETGAKPDVPDRKLAKFLSQSRISSRQQIKAKAVSSREMYVKCIHAWNAWRNGEPTNLNYYPTSKTPAVQ